MMLSLARNLNAAQIGGIIQRTASPLPGKTFEWATDAGYGRIEADKCISEALSVNEREDITKKLDANGTRDERP